MDSFKKDADETKLIGNATFTTDEAQPEPLDIFGIQPSSSQPSLLEVKFDDIISEFARQKSRNFFLKFKKLVADSMISVFFHQVFLFFHLLVD